MPAKPTKNVKAKAKAKIRTYRNAAQVASKSHRGGQGFESTSFKGEQRVVNREWATRLTHGRVECRRILTEKAKGIIKTNEALFRDRIDALEPPFMAPSTQVDRYSRWCSFCNDFGDTLVLCAGCRVGVCVATADSPNACFDWSPEIEASDFVFYCPFCVKGSCVLDLRRTLPHKMTVYFRYDPPVLIVAATWHETKVPYGRMLRDNLLRKYVNNEDSIMLMEVALDTAAQQAADDEGYRADNIITTDTSEAAEDFLQEHLTAKIVVVIDTHCLENGFLLWRGTTADDYKACTLLEILRDCIPSEVFQYLSNAEGTPDHRHKSIILNLSCGASIAKPASRDSLFDGHCADAVLSFANNLTLVGDIASALTDFSTRWVQTPSDYDFLVAGTMSADWCLKHQPVLSRNGQGHFLYSKFNIGRPGGMLVMCHLRCGKLVKSRDIGKVVQYTCTKCDSRCTTERILTDQETTLGRCALVKAEYPLRLYPAEWRLSKTNGHVLPRSTSLPTLPTSTPTSSTPKLTPSTSSSTLGGSLRIRIPARPPAISRSRSNPGMNDGHGATPTPPPPSPHEPSPTPSDLGKRWPVEGTSTGTETRKKQRR